MDNNEKSIFFFSQQRKPSSKEMIS